MYRLRDALEKQLSCDFEFLESLIILIFFFLDEDLKLFAIILIVMIQFYLFHFKILDLFYLRLGQLKICLLHLCISGELMLEMFKFTTTNKYILFVYTKIQIKEIT